MYKSAEQEAEEMDAKDGLPTVDSFLTILIRKVCQKCNVPGVIANSRLVQEFKNKDLEIKSITSKSQNPRRD